MNSKSKLELGFMRHKTDMPHISQEIVDYAIANNQAYFETCYFYLNNKCEDFIYSLLTKYNREDYELCGKMPVRTIMEQYGVKAIFEEIFSVVLFFTVTYENISTYCDSI